MTTTPTVPDRLAGRLGWVLASLVFVLAALLRFAGIGDAWLNPDEGIYYSVIAWPDLAQRRAEIAANAHPPLYYHLLWLWSRPSMAVVWLRVPAALAGVASVVAFFLLGRELAPGGRGVATGLLAAVLLAVSPSAIVLSQVIRPYTLQVALATFALLGLVRWHRRGSRSALVSYSLCMTVALLTHYSTVFVLGAAGVPLAASLLARRSRRAWFAVLAANALPVLALAWTYFAHVRPQLAGQALQVGAFETWLRPFIAKDPLQAWRQALGVPGYVFGDQWSAAGIVALAVAVGVGIARRAPIVWVAPVIGFGLAAVASLAQVYPFGPARHSVYLAPLLVLPIAWVVTEGLASRVPVRLAAVAAAALLVFGRLDLYGWLSSGDRDLIVRVSTLGEEKVLARSDLERAEPLLDRLKQTPGLLAMSIDTSHTLCPLWHAERAAGREVEGMRTFRWGERQVVVHSEWSFSLQGHDLGKGTTHLYDFVVKADRVLPELRLGKQHRLPMLFAGFTGSVMQALVAIDQERKGQPPLASGIVGLKGLGYLELDAALLVEKARAELGLDRRQVPAPASR